MTIRHLPKSTVRKLGIFAHGEEQHRVHRTTLSLTVNFPTLRYQNAVRQAFYDFSQKAERSGLINPETDEPFIQPLSRIIMHLPTLTSQAQFPDVFRTTAKTHHVGRVSPPSTHARAAGQRAKTPSRPGKKRRMRTAEIPRPAIRRVPCWPHRERSTASSLIGNQYTGSIFSP